MNTMSKPSNLKELLRDGHISIGEVCKIAESIFDGQTTSAGPEGYMITAVHFEDLPNHVRGFILKGILEFKVQNILDVAEQRPSEPSVFDTDG
jgi:hypothetical protein